MTPFVFPFNEWGKKVVTRSKKEWGKKSDKIQKDPKKTEERERNQNLFYERVCLSNQPWHDSSFLLSLSPYLLFFLVALVAACCCLLAYL